MCDSKEEMQWIKAADVLEKMLLHFEKDRQEYMIDHLHLRADLEQIRKKSTINSILITCLAVLMGLLAVLK